VHVIYIVDINVVMALRNNS